MKIKRKNSENPKKILESLNITNILIALCVVLIIVSLCIIIIPDGFWSKEKAESNTKTETVSEEKNIEVVKSSGKEISEEEAKKTAIKQFKKLGEKGLKTEQITAQKISRSGEFYYYVVSPNNNLEIRISDGEITRINTVLVNK